MHNIDFATFLLSLNKAQFSAIKKAVTVLVRAGFPRESAVQIIIEQAIANGPRLRRIS